MLKPHIALSGLIALWIPMSIAWSQEEPSTPSGLSSKAKSTKKGKAAEGDEETAESSVGVLYSAPRKMEMQFGMRFYSNDNYCTKLHATIPFPMNWPEQKVNIISSDIPSHAAVSWRDLPGIAKQPVLVRQLVMDIPSLSPNNELHLLVNVEIEKQFIDPPPDTSVFAIPTKVPSELNWFTKSSPYIDIELSEIKRVAKQIAAESPATAWEHVEKIYDWVRDNISYRKGKIRQIKDSLKDREGDCEEMTGIFVALCRASKIPARCVWIPDHCYPEFYLEDSNGKGHWFPCQVAGDRQFGQMHDYRPILQKGDRFKVPEDTAMKRYVSTFFTCKQRPSKPGLDPSVEEVRDLGPLKAELAAQQSAVPTNP